MILLLLLGGGVFMMFSVRSTQQEMILEAELQAEEMRIQAVIEQENATQAEASAAAEAEDPEVLEEEIEAEQPPITEEEQD